MIQRIALGLLAIRTSLLASSQWYGQEWQIAFLSGVYLYVFVVRLNLFGGGPARQGAGFHRADATVAALVALFLVIVFVGSPT